MLMVWKRRKPWEDAMAYNIELMTSHTPSGTLIGPKGEQPYFYGTSMTPSVQWGPFGAL